MKTLTHKQIRDLKAGDIFLDSLCEPILIEEIKLLPKTDIPRSRRMAKITFITQHGHRMFMRFAADRMVELVMSSK